MRSTQSLVVDLPSLDSLPSVKKHLRARLLDERRLRRDAVDSFHWGPAHALRTLEALGIPYDRASRRMPRTLPFRVASYFPVRGELDLMSFARPDWLFPAVGPQGSLTWFELGSDLHALPRNAYGIPERSLAECFQYDRAQWGPLLMFVPCLAVDRTGARLGYGGGYYDRFLEAHGIDVLSIACVDKDFLFENLPTEPHDRRVDLVITAEGPATPFDRQLLCKLRT